MPVRLTPAQAAAIADDYRARLRQCVPWSPAVKWAPKLNFIGDTYEVLELFPGVVASDDPVDSLQPGQFVDSPGRRFRYCVRLHRAGQPLLTWWGAEVGTVVFDSDVIIPALYQVKDDLQPGEPRWNEAPWMSLTPGEILTLRPGTRLAKGKVVIAGLGLGHQLIEVCKRLQVKRVVVVEIDQELVDWMMPALRPHLRKPVEVIVGDAFAEIPKLTADIALVDTFPGYGDGFRVVEQLARRSPGIKRFWGWGTSEMTGLAQRER
ncbi:MAG: hypothetical protein U0168_30585 [Nannocystaceae bacterium]